MIPNSHLPLETFIDLLSKVNFQTWHKKIKISVEDNRFRPRLYAWIINHNQILWKIERKDFGYKEK